MPLEEMNYLFTNAPILVAGHDKKAYQAHFAEDLERRALELREKTAEVEHSHEEAVAI